MSWAQAPCPEWADKGGWSLAWWEVRDTCGEFPPCDPPRGETVVEVERWSNGARNRQTSRSEGQKE